MADEKKSVGPLILGKKPGGEESAFMSYTMVEGDNNPVFVTVKYLEKQQAAATEAGKVAVEAVKSAVDKALSDAMPGLIDAVTKTATEAATASASKSATEAGGKAVAEAAKSAVVTSTPAGFNPTEGNHIANKSYVDAKVKGVNDSLIKIGIKLPGLNI